MTGRVFAFLYSLVYVKDLFSGVKVQWISRVIALREWDFKSPLVYRAVPGLENRILQRSYDRNGVEQPVGISHTQANAAFRGLSAEQVVFIGRQIFSAKLWLWDRMKQDFTCDVRTVISKRRSIKCMGIQFILDRECTERSPLFRPVEHIMARTGVLPL